MPIKIYSNDVLRYAKLYHISLEQAEKEYGGDGSGNFGHSGREGEVGGSGEGSSSSKRTNVQHIDKTFNNLVRSAPQLSTKANENLRVWTQNIQTGTITRKDVGNWLLTPGIEQSTVKQVSRNIIEKLPTYNKGNDTVTLYRTGGSQNISPTTRLQSWSVSNSKDSYTGKVSHGVSAFVTTKTVPVDSIIAIPQVSHKKWSEKDSYSDEYEVIVDSKLTASPSQKRARLTE